MYFRKSYLTFFQRLLGCLTVITGISAPGAVRADAIFNLTTLDNLGRPSLVGLGTNITSAGINLSRDASAAAAAGTGIVQSASILGPVVGASITALGAINKIVGISSASSPQEILSILSPIDTSAISAQISDSRSAVRSATANWVAPDENAFISLNDAVLSLFSQSAHDNVKDLYTRSVQYNASATALQTQLAALVSNATELSARATLISDRADALLHIVASIPGFETVALDLLAIEGTYADLVRQSDNLAQEAGNLLQTVKQGADVSGSAISYLAGIASSDIVQAAYSFSAPSITNDACGFTMGFQSNDFSQPGLDAMPRFFAGALTLTSLPNFSSTACSGALTVTAKRELLMPTLLGGGRVTSSGDDTLPFEWDVVLGSDGRYIHDFISFTSLDKFATIQYSADPSYAFPLIASIASPFRIIDILSPSNLPGAISSVPEPANMALVAIGLAALAISRGKKRFPVQPESTAVG